MKILPFLLLLSFLFSCGSMPPDEIKLTTNGEVTLNEQLWLHLGANYPYQKDGYKIYHRDKFVGVLKVQKALYDKRQSEGEYEWASLSSNNPLVKGTLVCYNSLIMGNGNGNCLNLDKYIE